ncbi:MAG: hypothetical protein ACPGXZ_15825 [Saprospiraceae bacterium]
MKKIVFLFVFGCFIATTSLSSCRSAACPAYETTSAKSNKKTGKLSKRRGNSNLFPRGMRNK